MENLQQKCKDPVVLKAVVDQKNSDEIKMVFFTLLSNGCHNPVRTGVVQGAKPYSNLPEMKGKQLRIAGMKEKVWTRKK